MNNWGATQAQRLELILQTLRKKYLPSKPMHINSRFGELQPSITSTTKLPLEVVQPVVSTGSETKVLSTEVKPVAVVLAATNSTREKEMGLSLLAVIAKGISEAVAITKVATPVVTSVFTTVASMVVDAEAAYEKSDNAGATKLQSVLAGGEAFAADVGVDFSSIKNDVVSMITAIKAISNTATAAAVAVPTSATAAATTAAAQVPAATSAVATPGTTVITS